jgi:hypothetical protein
MEADTAERRAAFNREGLKVALSKARGELPERRGRAL